MIEPVLPEEPPKPNGDSRPCIDDRAALTVILFLLDGGARFLGWTVSGS